MSEFLYTEMLAGEELPFGVSTQSSSSSNRVVVNNIETENSATKSERRVAISNQRIIVEEALNPAATQIIPIAAVQTVVVRHEDFMGSTVPIVERVQTNAGETVDLNIRLFDESDEATLRELFSAASFEMEQGKTQDAKKEEKKKKGMFGW